MRLTGEGCDPGAPVVFEVDDRAIGSSAAGAGGDFSSALDLPDLRVGRHRLVARCGPVLATSLDVVLVTRSEPTTTSFALLLFFILLALAVIRRQRGTRRARP